jgi:hypothetical protein
MPSLATSIAVMRGCTLPTSQARTSPAAANPVA